MGFVSLWDRRFDRCAPRGRGSDWARSFLIGAFLAVCALGCGDAPTGATTVDPQSTLAVAGKSVPAPGLARAATDTPADQSSTLPDTEWTQHGLTTGEQRYSPLEQIHAGNVARLTQRWSFATGLDRGHEATPLVVGGVMYLTGSWSVVFALDARTGRELWRYDPEVPRAYARKACCDVVNRGVAYDGGRIFVGTLDGRLLALDAKSGERIWEVVTVDRELSYTITGAPRVVEGKVLIGNGGAEFGVRGYVSAYSADSGALVWRTYTVPGDPHEPFESKALERAAETWKGGEWWKIGGGGTVWDSMAFDPELHLLYVGTGNGSPWTRHLRSPGGGDNLYLSSILALDPDTGNLVWYYQTTPGDNWDFTATQHIILADLEIDGKRRKVLMQAPKNGFFYVLDRTNGELISAEKYVTVSWASQVDLATGRPIEVPGQDYKEGLAIVQPTAFGGHNWHPMSFNPETGLVYIPAQEIAGAYRLDPNFEVRPGEFNTGTDFNVFSGFTRDLAAGHLLAWDPVAGREVWRQPYALPWNGGTLTTAGNLVFQGTADGRFVAYRARDGAKLWEAHTDTGIIAAPITYALDGRQYVSVVAGFGGAFGLAAGDAAAGAKTGKTGRVLTFALPGPLPEPDQIEAALSRTGGLFDGERLYHTYCVRCHGAAAIGTVLPDLRRMAPETEAAFEAIVRNGAYEARGMPAFSEFLDPAEAQAILDYIRSRRDS